MKVCAVQYRPPKADPAAARNEIAAFAKEACGHGAQIVVFPEMASAGYIWKGRDAILPHAERADGELFQALSPIAAEHSSWIVCGFPEIADDSLFNSAIVISPAGEIAACYRKVLLFDADMSWALPGDTRYLIGTDSGKIAPGICMDLNDDGFTSFARQHASVIPFCTNWLEEGLDVHEYWRLRLEGFKGILIAANSWGFDGVTEFCGRSAVFAQGMKCIASAGREGNCLVFADV